MSLMSYVFLALFIFLFYKFFVFLKSLVSNYFIKKQSRLYYKLSFGFESGLVKYCSISSHVLYRPVDVYDMPDRVVLYYDDYDECKAAFDFIISNSSKDVKKKSFSAV